MSRALIVGIDHYQSSPLKGCVGDAKSMAASLSRHQDGQKNFFCMTCTSDEREITRSYLLNKIRKLFEAESDLALFYFSGHGYDNKLGGLLVTQEAKTHADGVDLDDILTMANKATHIKQIFIILDCCHSGNMGNPPLGNGYSSLLRKNISILTSSQSEEESVERKGRGVFTYALLNGLNGGAADLMGNVTAASLYSYVDNILGPWDQRPVFKSHVNQMYPLRKCNCTLSLNCVRQLMAHFPEVDHQFKLDPSYEPTSEPANCDREAIFSQLQRYVSVGGLIRAVDCEHLYHAATESKSCELTPIGKMYWHMVRNEKI
ncbi:MAG: caspase family protein [Cyclobacteriaceae bacterium]